MTFEQYKNTFSVDMELLDQMKEMAEQEGIVYDEEIQSIKRLDQLTVKALIARDIWSMNEYYRIMDAENEALQRAVHILRNPDEYSQILSKNLEHETLISEFAPHNLDLGTHNSELISKSCSFIFPNTSSKLPVPCSVWCTSIFPFSKGSAFGFLDF